jgi:hypothetical protein
MDDVNEKQGDLADVLMKIGEELGLDHVTAFNCLDAIRELKRKLDPSSATAWALVQAGSVLQTTHDSRTAAYMKEANLSCEVRPLVFAAAQ